MCDYLPKTLTLFMKLAKLYIFFVLLAVSKVFGTEVSLREFGAAGNGIDDDTKSLVEALKFAAENKLTVNGEGLNYNVTGKVELDIIFFSLKNCNFITSNSYSNQFALRVICENVKLSNINFDGGRNTYKTNTEEWKDFSSENGIISIYPTTDDLFYFVALNTNAILQFENVKMKNIHASSCITVITHGKVLLDDLDFNNVSNKTFHIYHSTNEGLYQNGKTFAGNITSIDVGILPSEILYKNKIISNKNINVMPQASFNFIVSFGEYHIKKAIVHNYGSSGVTSDRNILFKADYINITNNSDKGFSNNPSGAMWFEATSIISVNRIDIDIEKRDSRDIEFDSSALSFYGHDTVSNIDTLNIKGKFLNKGLRGSFAGKNNISFDYINLEGTYQQAAALFALIPNEKIQTKVNIHNLAVKKGTVEFYGIKEVNISKLNGRTGDEQLNFKLPYSISGSENYNVESTDFRNVYKSNTVKNIQCYDMLKRKVIIKTLN